MDNFGFKNYQQFPPVVTDYSDQRNKKLGMIKNDAFLTLMLLSFFSN